MRNRISEQSATILLMSRSHVDASVSYITLFISKVDFASKTDKNSRSENVSSFRSVTPVHSD